MPTTAPGADLVVAPSAHDVPTTVARLVAALDRRGITVFATIDHATGARQVGLELADEVLLVFGNPAGGTAVMQADPRAGLDLPLRVLVWSRGGATSIAFHDPRALADAYDLAGVAPVLERLRTVLEAVTGEAA